MTELLLRLFIKGYPDTKNEKVRSNIGKFAGTMGIFCNTILSIGKMLTGLAVGSVSIVADGLNNLTDLAASITTLIGFRLAQRPADEGHPYGHARYEYLSGLVVAIFIFVVGVELAKSSFDKILHPQAVSFNYVTFGILVASITIKLWMSGFFIKLGAKIHSSTLKATGIDSRNDVITTCVVLLGAVISLVTGLNIDGYMGIAVSFFIFYSGWNVASETISPLLGQQADKELIESISAFILSYDEVLDIHDLLVHDYGPGKCFASVHVEVDGEGDLLSCHDAIDEIEHKALEEMNVNLVIHYDPILTHDEEWNRMKQIVTECVKSIDDKLSIHGFRIVYGEKNRIDFDLEIPYSMTQKQKEIKERLEKEISVHGDYVIVIGIDGKA